MNTRHLLSAAAFALAAGGLAHAEGPLEDGRLFVDTPTQAAAAPVSRTAVVDALRSTPAHITALATEAGVPMSRTLSTQRSRAEVLAEARSAVASGAYLALVAESNSFDGVNLRPSGSETRLARASR